MPRLHQDLHVANSRSSQWGLLAVWGKDPRCGHQLLQPELMPCQATSVLARSKLLAHPILPVFLEQLAVVGIILGMLLPEITAIVTLAEGLTVLRGQATP